MYFEKLDDLESNLIMTRFLMATDKGNYYQTTHEKYTVDISHEKDADYNGNHLVISFKDSSGNEEFKIEFDSKSTNRNRTPKKNLVLFVANSEVNNEVQEKLLGHINFNNFLDNEIKKVRNHIRTEEENSHKEAKDEELKLKQAIESTIFKIGQNEENTEIDFKQLKEKLIQLSINTNLRIVCGARRNMCEYSSNRFEDIKIYKEKFKDFDITYKESNKNDLYGNHTEISLLFTNQRDGINFQFDLTNINSNKVPNLGLKFNDKIVLNSKLTNELFVKFGADRFLTTFLDKLETLELAEEAQRKINQEVTKLKTQDLLNDDPSAKKINFENVPLEINGAKIWLNAELKLDRKNGPAIENYDGKDFWFDNGDAMLPIIKVKEQKILDSTHSVVSNVLNKFRNMLSSNTNSSKNKIH